MPRAHRLWMPWLLMVGLLLAPALSGCATAGGTDASRGKARNVILLIGDGLGPTHFWAASVYSTRILKKELRMAEAMRAGRTAYLVNDTADATVTESGAAAGQIATGQRMRARTLSVARDGTTPVTTIMEMAKRRGLATGLVTTSGITDATPGAFAAHLHHRSDEAAVADQQLAFGVDVLMGGRKQFFLPEISAGRRKDGRNLLDEARSAGYAVVGDAEELKAAKGSRILGLFSMGDMAHEIDRRFTRQPSLAQMTAKALDVLSRNPKGFFAVIEGGRIDHASHRNDATGTIHDTLAFDAAVGVALDLARKQPDSLVIVAADHETGGMALVGQGRTGDGHLGLAMEAIQKAQASFEVVAAELGTSPTPQKIQQVVKTYLGIELTDREAATVADDVIRKLDPSNYGHAYLHSLAFVLRPHLGVGWATHAHTASPLFAFGVGPGSERIGGLLHNTQLFDIMTSATE